MTYAHMISQLSDYQMSYDTDTPVIRLWDKEHNFLCNVGEVNSITFDEKINGAGGIDIQIPYDSIAAQYFLGTEDYQMTMVTVDVSGHRWHGALTDPEIIHDEKGSYINLRGLHSWQHLESILFWANPLFPAQFQPLAGDYRIGPARTVLASLLAVNLARLQLPLWQIPTYIDFFDPAQWNIFKRTQWPIAVKPVNPITDTSRWCVSAPTFQTAAEIIKEIADDESGLSVEMNLWLPGDPQPWPLADFSRPTYWIDIVDYSIERNFTGTLVDGLIKVGIDAVDDAAAFVLYPILGEAILGEDGQGLLRDKLNLEVRDSVPVYRAANTPDSGVVSHSIVQHKPLASQVVVGGKSPEFVNKSIDIGGELIAAGLMSAISAGAGAAGAGLAGAGLPMVGPALGMVSGLDLKPATSLATSMMHDKLFAYFAWENYAQAFRAGPYRYREVAKLGGTGLGLMMFQDIVNATYSQRPYTSHKVEVMNSHPYRLHEEVKLGGLVGIDIPDSEDMDGHPKVHVGRVTAISFTYDRNNANSWDISIGDQAADVEPGQRSLERLRDVMKKLNKLATNSATV